MTEEDYCQLCADKAAREYRRPRPTPPGTLRFAHCEECGGEYYCSEAQHRAAFHSRSPSE